jgi:hypothetical protein
MSRRIGLLLEWRLASAARLRCSPGMGDTAIGDMAIARMVIMAIDGRLWWSSHGSWCLLGCHISIRR